MKKICILFIMLLLTISTAFALSKPRWDVRPVKVYIPPNHYYTHLMKNAFLQWQDKTKSAVWFVFVNENKQKDAHITVHFVEKNVNCEKENAIGCTHIQTNDEDFYVHNDIYIASKTTRNKIDKNGKPEKIEVPISSEQVYRVMLHEIGHAIGIHGHSLNPNSIMYAYSNNNDNNPQTITEEDIQFMHNVYR